MRKKLTYFAITASVAATLTVVSCAPDSPPTAPSSAESQAAQQQKLQVLQDKYGWVGQYHTDGLAYIYSQLAKGKGKARGHAELCKIAAKAAKEFHKSARHSEVPAALMDQSENDEVCPADIGSSSVRASVMSIPAGRTRVRHDISSTATSYIDQIATLAGSATSKYALVSGVNSIESRATSLPTEEAGAVVAVGSVAVSSATYWEANLSSWMELSGVQPAFALTAQDMTRATVSSVASAATGRRFTVPWWKNPFVGGFQRVLVSDALAAARVIYTAWEIGPIVLDAAAAAALWASSVAAITSIFF